MPKKSHRTAATYAMKSKARKASGRPNIPTHYPTNAAVADTEYADDIVQSQDKVDYSGYRYVVSDLRRMGILIGGLAVILIIITIFLS